MYATLTAPFIQSKLEKRDEDATHDKVFARELRKHTELIGHSSQMRRSAHNCPVKAQCLRETEITMWSSSADRMSIVLTTRLGARQDRRSRTRAAAIARQAFPRALEKRV